MKVTQYSTNSYGEFFKSDISPAVFMEGAKTVTAVKDSENTSHLGLGVAITGSSCYNLSLMEKTQRTELLKALYGSEGLGLSIARLSVGSSDYSAELYTYDDVEGDVSLEHFSVERDERYIIPIIKEILSINPDLKLFASPWSPPAWMKTGGSVCGGYMREEYIDCYADYIVKFILAYKERGISLYALTPQNETETHQQGRMPACIWHPDIEARYIIALKKKLLAAGLDTKIWMFDHNFDGVRRVDWTLEQYPQLRSDCDGIAFHYYSGSVEQTEYLKVKYPELSLHFTEGGPRLYDNYATDWCKWGIMISKTLGCGYSSFTGWNLMLDEMGGPNVGPFFCGGLITRRRDDGELSYSGQYKALRHISPFIKPSSVIYRAEFSADGSSMFSFPKTAQPLTGAIIENKDSTALVLVNANTEKAQLQYFAHGSWWYIELLPDTLATVIFEE